MLLSAADSDSPAGFSAYHHHHYYYFLTLVINDLWGFKKLSYAKKLE